MENIEKLGEKYTFSRGNKVEKMKKLGENYSDSIPLDITTGHILKWKTKCEKNEKVGGKFTQTQH